MATYEQNKQFVKDVLPNNLLDETIDWITNNLSIGDVFDEDVIVQYVAETSDVDDVYDDEPIIKYVQSAMEPDDVFSIDDLASWAENNGFVRS